MTKKISTSEFLEMAIQLARGETTLYGDIAIDFINKAESLLVSEMKKIEYAKNHKRESKVSDTTKHNAELIKSVLCTDPLTAQEISDKLNIEIDGLTVSNAVRYLMREMDIEKTQVIITKEKIGKKDNTPKTEKKLKTAYFIPA